MSYQEIALILKVLADAKRLEIIDILSCGELCACDLLEHFQFSQPTLSHHMKSLVDSGIVSSRKEGNKRLYKLNREKLNEVKYNLDLINTSNHLCICNQIEKGECQS
ncbi:MULTISPECIES: ArsR/SmtB family transcription factor [Staphylococcus]|uniref:Metalloregulator ArsR/SmtB family transcription factor n=1 Tax=Staphylococcus hsinchuensis TaxID=3051183 RepID=A0ABZ3EA68_9STAP|nr:MULTISPECIES: metalloregulator ArsR/SmtB family transcription factor [unclassified Staphylococcus]